MATLFDQASLVMIPSGYKDDKLYSIKPNDGSGDFTFSREGSGASVATRVDASGNIEKGRTNLLLQSNQFDTTWLATNATGTSGYSGYDGTTDAWLLESTGASCRISQTISTSGVQTMSVYAKSGSVEWMALYVVSTSPPYVYFDLANGVLGGVQNNVIDAGLEDMGNGWYRCYITFDKTATEVRIFTATGNGSLTTASGDSIYIMDTQLEKSLVPTTYIETRTTTESRGLLGDMPRLDYSGGASCPSLLLEPSRTNLVPFSEHLGASDWGKTRCTIEDNSITSPEGLINGAKMTSTDASESYIQDNFSFTGSTIVWSFFAKKGDLDYCHGLVWDLSANGCRQWFNLNDGTVGGSTTFGSGYSVSSATIEDAGNGWYRCTMIVSGSSGSNGCRVNISSANTTITSAVNSYGYFYGLQAEDSSYPTSYIPTYGSATVRAVDDVNEITGFTSNIGQNEGSLFLDFVANDEDALQIIYQVRTTGSTNVGQIDFRIQSGNLRALGNDAGTNQFNISAGAVVAGTRYKCAVRYKLNDVAFYVNGSLVGADASASFASSTLEQIGFNENTGSFFPSVSIKQALLFPTALTDAELQALTTL